MGAVCCVNCMLWRPTTDSCMLLRCRSGRNVQCNLFFHEWNIFHHWVIGINVLFNVRERTLVTVKVTVMWGFLFFFFILYIFLSFSRSIPFSHFKIMQDYVSIFYAGNIKLSCFSSYPSLSLSRVPGDTSLRMTALICRKTSWKYWFQKVHSSPSWN